MSMSNLNSQTKKKTIGANLQREHSLSDGQWRLWKLESSSSNIRYIQWSNIANHIGRMINCGIIMELFFPFEASATEIFFSQILK